MTSLLGVVTGAKDFQSEKVIDIMLFSLVLIKLISKKEFCFKHCLILLLLLVWTVFVVVVAEVAFLESSHSK